MGTYSAAILHLQDLVGPMGLLYGIYGGLEVLDGSLWGSCSSPMGMRSQAYGELMGARG